MIPNVDQFADILQQNKIKYRPNSFCSKVEIFKVNETAASQVVTLSVAISYFTFEVTLLNLEIDSPSREYLKLMAKGSDGRIFVGYMKYTGYFAVKNIRYFTHKQIQNSLKQEKLNKIIV